MNLNRFVSVPGTEVHLRHISKSVARRAEVPFLGLIYLDSWSFIGEQVVRD